MRPETAHDSTMSTTEYYTCKWGRVIILHTDNYSEWHRTCKAALISASAWPIVNGIRARTGNANALNDWDTMNARGAMIIFNSVSSNLQTTISAEVDNQDVTAMWTKLAVYDRTTDNVYAGNLKGQFYALQFQHKTETLRSFVSRLETIQAQLANTPFSLSERDMIDRILQALPNESQWQNQRQFCYRENLNLAQTINSLQSIESPLISDSSITETAAMVRVKKSGKGKCFFCEKSGHMRDDCIQYKKAKQRLKRRRNRDQDSDSESESSVEERPQKRRKGRNRDSSARIMTVRHSNDIVEL